MKTLYRLAAAAAFLGAASAAQAQDVNIIVVSHGQANDPFWSVVKNGVDAAAKDMAVTVDYRAPETFDMVVMSQLIDAAVNQEPDGLIVSIPDADAGNGAIRRRTGWCRLSLRRACLSAEGLWPRIAY